MIKTSIIITAYKEERTIKKAIEQALKNEIPNSEIIIIAPDKKTLQEAQKTASKNKKRNIRTIKDPGRGKPEALNIAVKNAKGQILVLTDGDVFMSENAIKPLLEPFNNPKIGAVSGRPVSKSPKNTMLGHWARVLSETAHKRRKHAIKNEQRIFCSGYLFAIRKKHYQKLKPEILSEDGYMSNNVYQKGDRIAYSQKSEVYIKYPTTFSDWIIQKKRSTGGYNQIKKMTGAEIRSFKQEITGVLDVFSYAKSPKQALWTLTLLFARIYLWAVIYKDINLKKKSHKEIWKRVETTK